MGEDFIFCFFFLLFSTLSFFISLYSETIKDWKYVNAWTVLKISIVNKKMATDTITHNS